MVLNSAPSGGLLSALSSLSKLNNCPLPQNQNGWPTLTRRASHSRQNELGFLAAPIGRARKRANLLVLPDQLKGITEFSLNRLQAFP